MLKQKHTAGLAWMSVLAIAALSGVAHSETSKYRLTARQDPARAITIGWCQDSGDDATVYYGPRDRGQRAKRYPNRASADRSVSFRGMEHRFVRLTGLKPNTAYYFVIRDSDSTSPRLWFRTLPARPGPIHLVAGGDSRNNREARQKANRMVAKLRPQLVAFAGDFTASGSPKQWRQWLNDWQLTIGEDGKMVPIVPARGNHEPSNKHVRHIFDTPGRRNYYAINIAGNYIRFYTLNSEISVAGKQTDWLKRDLAQQGDNARWRIAQYHKPMRPHTRGKPDGARIYDNWAGLFHKHNVQLAIECDSHMTKITWPIRPADGHERGAHQGFVRDDRHGTVYIGEGCWGAPLRPANDKKPWTRAAATFNQVKWLRITPRQIQVRTVNVENVEAVPSVSSRRPWKPPRNLKLWKIPGGSAATIPAR